MHSFFKFCQTLNEHEQFENTLIAYTVKRNLFPIRKRASIFLSVLFTCVIKNECALHRICAGVHRRGIKTLQWMKIEQVIIEVVELIILIEMNESQYTQMNLMVTVFFSLEYMKNDAISFEWHINFDIWFMLIILCLRKICWKKYLPHVEYIIMRHVFNI